MTRWHALLLGFALVVAGCSGSSGPTVTTVAPTSTSEPGATTTTLPPGVAAVLYLDHRPSGIVIAGDVIWTEDHAWIGRAYAIDPESGATLASFEINRPCDLAATDGRLWVADLERGMLVWIDTTTLSVGGEIAGLAGPCALQVVEGALWFVVDNGLARLDLSTEEVTVTDLGGGAFPGSGSPLWAAMFKGGDLVRIDTATGAAELTIPHPAGSTDAPAVAAGFDSLWVGSSTNTLYRLDPVTGAVVAEIPATQVTRLLITDGGVWLTSFERGVVERVGPATNQVVFRVHLGGNPNGIAAGLGSIWVADTMRGHIYRFDPLVEGLDS